jgi:hypothetical protein
MLAESYAKQLFFRRRCPFKMDALADRGDASDSSAYLSSDDESAYAVDQTAYVDTSCTALAIPPRAQRAETSGIGTVVPYTNRMGGRPPAVVMDDATFEWLVREQYTSREIAVYFGAEEDAVKRKKKALGLVHLQPAAPLPPLEVLQQVWELNPRTTIASVAAELEVSATTLRRHFQAVGFVPSEIHGFDVVAEALQDLLSNVEMRVVGVPFAQALLWSERGISARAADVHRALKRHDPAGHRKRTKEAAKTQYVYNVAGPRSCYHCDAHEKLAKIWGFWVHLCIDGYSRRLIYLSVKTDKFAETVRKIYHEACEANGWPARCRWDKGSENAGAIAEQLAHHAAKGGDSWRGCALTGRSSQNCRAEYIWNFFKRHVSQPYRELFFKMMRELRILDPNEPTDLFVLQAVFLRRIQAATDRFRRMWNSHKIRGKRTVRGHGGGIPDELWLDAMEERVLCDDEAYGRHQGLISAAGVDDETCTYAVAEPFKGDTVELTHESLATEDPIGGSDALAGLLRSMRTAYFETVSFEWDREGIAEYREYWSVCRELIAVRGGGWLRADGSIDWDGYYQAASGGDSERVRRTLCALVK